MKQPSDTRALLEGLRNKISTLPDHSPAEIESVARHLEMLHYQNILEPVDKNFIRYRKGDALKKLEEVSAMSEAVLKANPTVVEEWDNPKVSPEENRARRMKLIYGEYRKLCALRSNDPTAWDQINELYYDD